nr:hypothetical protein [Tanacetum cinerariifolium]
GVVIQDTPSAPKLKPATSKLKLMGVQSLTPKEQEAADIKHALKKSKITGKRLPHTRGSSEGTGRIPGVPDESTIVSATSGVPHESTVVFATSSEETGTKPGVPDKENNISKEKVVLEWGSKEESECLEEDQLDEEKDDKDVQLRVAKLQKDVFKLKKIDLSTEALASLKTQVLIVVEDYLGSIVGDVF